MAASLKAGSPARLPYPRPAADSWWQGGARSAATREQQKAPPRPPGKGDTGRGESAVLYAKRTTCNFGHPLDGKKRDSKSGRLVRYCKTCAREKSLKRYYDLKAAQPPRSLQTGEEVPQSA